MLASAHQTYMPAFDNFRYTELNMVSSAPKLDIIIVGAGLSGLGAAISCALGGHSVKVLEAASQIAEVGAGLQITPNASKILQHWQLRSSFWEAGAEPTKLTVHRYDGKVLAHQSTFSEKIRSRYGAPFIDMHRADLQQALVARAKDLGVQFFLGERVDDIDFESTTVRTVSGNSYSGDLIVAADGLWSKCRELFLGRKDEPLPTGDLAYRIVLSAKDIEDEALRSWIRNPECHFWIGPESHVVGYSLKGGEQFNLVLLCPDNLPEGLARQAGSLDEMRKLFEGWDPVLTRFLSCVKTVDKWKLMHREEMESWVNEKSNLVFIGDSCHAMLPYLAQGANSSLEDGAVLGLILGKISDKSQLAGALHMYENLRKKRGEAIVRETFKQRRDFHMPDGAEQEARDRIFMSRFEKEDETNEPFPSRWTCPVVQRWLYGYDAVREVEEAVAANPTFQY
ncbi:uncharacterized protein PV09_07719 [Verruconis gallopava]|uniref:FAD-binding domain-containing protein n=1 Tax=Verruconis gallopava TaxID=253628 RepID=A0A0D2A2X5_9PEZI|nr:uncharacterized protein PV09_07719 [Verruconis gallopava]KIW00735.1 hypothetical protein PV09_07719 [Verruconis gallopava]